MEIAVASPNKSLHGTASSPLRGYKPAHEFTRYVS